jgi:hypothetical protein
MNTEYDETAEMEASERRPKKKRLTEILASMSSDEERTAYLESIPVHATQTLGFEWQDRFSQSEEDAALKAARDVKFRQDALGDAMARHNWKF